MMKKIEKWAVLAVLSLMAIVLLSLMIIGAAWSFVHNHLGSILLVLAITGLYFYLKKNKS